MSVAANKQWCCVIALHVCLMLVPVESQALRSQHPHFLSQQPKRRRLSEKAVTCDDTCHNQSCIFVTYGCAEGQKVHESETLGIFLLKDDQHGIGGLLPAVAPQAGQVASLHDLAPGEACLPGTDIATVSSDIDESIVPQTTPTMTLPPLEGEEQVISPGNAVFVHWETQVGSYVRKGDNIALVIPTASDGGMQSPLKEEHITSPAEGKVVVLADVSIGRRIGNGEDLVVLEPSESGANTTSSSAGANPGDGEAATAEASSTTTGPKQEDDSSAAISTATSSTGTDAEEEGAGATGEESSGSDAEEDVGEEPSGRDAVEVNASAPVEEEPNGSDDEGENASAHAGEEPSGSDDVEESKSANTTQEEDAEEEGAGSSGEEASASSAGGAAAAAANHSHSTSSNPEGPDSPNDSQELRVLPGQLVLRNKEGADEFIAWKASVGDTLEADDPIAQLYNATIGQWQTFSAPMHCKLEDRLQLKPGDAISNDMALVVVSPTGEDKLQASTVPETSTKSTTSSSASTLTTLTSTLASSPTEAEFDTAPEVSETSATTTLASASAAGTGASSSSSQLEFSVQMSTTDPEAFSQEPKVQDALRESMADYLQLNKSSVSVQVAPAGATAAQSRRLTSGAVEADFNVTVPDAASNDAVQSKVKGFDASAYTSSFNAALTDAGGDLDAYSATASSAALAEGPSASTTEAATTVAVTEAAVAAGEEPSDESSGSDPGMTPALIFLFVVLVVACGLFGLTMAYSHVPAVKDVLDKGWGDETQPLVASSYLTKPASAGDSRIELAYAASFVPGRITLAPKSGDSDIPAEYGAEVVDVLDTALLLKHPLEEDLDQGTEVRQGPEEGGAASSRRTDAVEAAKSFTTAVALKGDRRIEVAYTANFVPGEVVFAGEHTAKIDHVLDTALILEDELDVDIPKNTEVRQTGQE